MIRQYRIDRFNGMELLVCECFRKHTWSQLENDAFFAWKEDVKRRSEQDFSRSAFNQDLEDFFASLPADSQETFYGLRYPIPVYDNYPAVILRGPVVDNRLASLQVEYVQSVLPPEVCDEVRRFFGFLESRHWRNTISHQIDRYGSLFESPVD